MPDDVVVDDGCGDVERMYAVADAVAAAPPGR